VVIDELAILTMGSGNHKKLCSEFSNLLRDLVSRGRAAGIVVMGATQKPSSDIVPTALSDSWDCGGTGPGVDGTLVILPGRDRRL
jgi:S-DNA-T family DNA segregation ATPase FtsK/SpoIIIE